MTSKLNFDLSKGTLEVEGDEALVREIYKDFRDALAQRAGSAPESGRDVSRADAEPTRRRRIKRQATGDAVIAAAKKPGVYSPRLDTSLDLRELDRFYSQFAPSNNYERILIFADFLRTKLDKAPCTADSIYSCFQKLRSKIKTPTAFSQALIDCRGKQGYIDYSNYDSISITVLGDNYLNHDMKRAEAE